MKKYYTTILLLATSETCVIQRKVSQENALEESDNSTEDEIKEKKSNYLARYNMVKVD